MAGLQRLFDACTPRDEVLSREFRDEMFMASLEDVRLGRAHPIYQEPDQFFANTYPTARLQSFLREVAGRLSGQDKTAAAFFRLDTPFGGGKTHTLIALYHLATAKLDTDVLARLNLDGSAVPSDTVNVAAIAADRLDPANGVAKEDGVRVHHLWGELAYQLGGREGYALVERSDTQGQAPGPHFLDQLIGDRPALILIDEPALYMRTMGPAAGQLPAFVKTLAEWVTSAPRTVLVLTLAWDAERARPGEDAFTSETEALERTFREVQSVVARPVRVVTPAEKQDIEPILKQRLFKSVDDDVAAAVADAYAEALRSAHQRGTPLPAATVQGTFRETLRRSYPFHPSLIEVLDGKLATIPNFQRTRGALRLLVKVVRRLWTQGEAGELLLHPFSLDLADPDLVDEVVGRLDRPSGFRSVVTYDVARGDGEAHAQAIDRERFAGHPPYTQRIATTVFLHSLPEPPARGADLEEVFAATLTPDTDPAHLQKAVQYLLDEAWHLDFQGNRYFFSTEANPNKVVRDETEAVPLHDARAEVERRIKQLWRDAGLEVEYFSGEPSELKDEAKGRLVLPHWDTVAFRAGSKAAPEHIVELWQYAGVQWDYRRYQNTLFFLVADADRYQRMVDVARRFLALEWLLKDVRKLDEYKLSKEQRDRIKQWRSDADLQLRVAITRAYCHLFYPSSDADSPYKPFSHYHLQIEDQGDTRANHTVTVLQKLRELGKVKSADDGPLAPALVKQSAFGKDEGSVPLRTLFERFAERVRLPLLLEPTYLKDVVRLGVRGKEWLYYDQTKNLAYETDQDITDIVIDDQHEVLLVKDAQQRGIPIYRREPPPKKDEEKEPARTGGGGTGGGGISNGKGTYTLERLEVEDEPRKALADLAARATDANWKGIKAVRLDWRAEGKDGQDRIAAIRRILGQLSAASASVKVSAACEYADGATWETDFNGPAARYQGLASTLENLVGHAEKVSATVGLRLEFPSGLPLNGPDYDDLRDTLDVAGLGRTRITAEPLRESEA